MKISGFSFVRNAVDLYYPVVESIRSILPICDEFVIAAGDSTDGTTELLRSIADPKLKIIETVWDPKTFVRGASNAQQSNIALAACSGDWAFYLQADEVVHEADLDPLVRKLETYRDDARVEGLLFEYLHFFADYDHHAVTHNWYRREVRIVRTHRGIESWKSAQGFRRAGKKIHVVPAAARIFHYGWVRPPRRMTKKSKALHAVHRGEADAAATYRDEEAEYNFGRLLGRRRFDGAHPAVMRERIAQYNWRIEPKNPSHHDHDKRSVRALSWLENRVLGFRIGEHRNYILLPP